MSQNSAIMETEDEGFVSAEVEESQNSNQSEWSQPPSREGYAGIIGKICLENFMCHAHLSVVFNERINFIIGENGAGKSSIITGICVALGGNAASTNRGQSLQKFMKTGCHTAKITLVLNNSGERAFNPKVYGKTITVVRTITDKANQIKLVNHAGAVIPIKRGELQAMLQHLNIQIDNPVAILNQIKARTFLSASDERKLYEVYSQATQINEMNFLFSDIIASKCSVLAQILNLEKTKIGLMKDIRRLQNVSDVLEKTEHVKVKKESLEDEFLWAVVHRYQAEIAENMKVLENVQCQIAEFQKQLDDASEREDEIRQKILELEAILSEFRNNSKQLDAQCGKAREDHRKLKAVLSSKRQDLQFVKRRLQVKESELVTVNEEISNLESKETENNTGQLDAQTRKAELQEKLCAMNAAIEKTEEQRSTLKVLKFHLRNRSTYCGESIHLLNKEQCSLKNQLQNLTPRTSVNIFGEYMDALVKRIASEGQFIKEPIGPLGKYIRVTAKAWAPAVENFIGPNILKSFLVDNSKDAVLLKKIMTDVCRKNRPAIHCNSFHTKVYSGVCQNEATFSGYKNLLRSLEISDVNVANLLIDILKIESVLLIEDNELITQLFENERTVPVNCSKCINKLGDTFFPAPNFRVYSGLDPRRPHQNRLLQVSVTDVQKALKENVREVSQKLDASQDEHLRLLAQLQETSMTLDSLSIVCRNKRQELVTVRGELAGLKEEEDTVCEEFRLPILRDLASSTEAEIREFKSEISGLEGQVEYTKRDVDVAKNELERLLSQINGKDEADIVATLDEKKDELKEVLVKMRDVAKSLIATTEKATDKEKDIALLKEKEKYHRSEAAAVCEEMDTRDVDSVGSELRDAQKYIQSMEELLGGSSEDLSLGLERKRKQYKFLSLSLCKLKKLVEDFSRLIEARRIMFDRFLNVNTADVKINFQCALKVRQFEGKLDIHHNSKQIKVRVAARQNAELTDLKLLSGGERSYATVSFVMALWRSTDIPFYSMDEFDVFMDQVNLDYATDLLLNMARLKSDSQFIFLTPREMAKGVKPSETLSIFRLEAPKRQDNEAERD